MSRQPIHPGEILADELDEIGLTGSELARRIDVPPNRISEIIRGRRGVTGDTALRLGHWFGTTLRFWTNLQAAYDLRLAVEYAGQAIERLPRRLAQTKPPPGGPASAVVAHHVEFSPHAGECGHTLHARAVCRARYPALVIEHGVRFKEACHGNFGPEA